MMMMVMIGVRVYCFHGAIGSGVGRGKKRITLGGVEREGNSQKGGDGACSVVRDRIHQL